MIFCLEWLYFHFSEFGKGDILTDCIFFFCFVFYSVVFLFTNFRSKLKILILLIVHVCLTFLSMVLLTILMVQNKEKRLRDHNSMRKLIITVTYGTMNEMSM